MLESEPEKGFPSGFGAFPTRDDSDVFGMTEFARRPVLLMIDPSDFDSRSVDWTPGFAARRARFSSEDVGFSRSVNEQ